MSTRQEQRQACIERAKDAIDAGTIDTGEAIKLAKELKDLDEFGYAWRLLERLRQSDEVTKDDALDLRFRQEIALCTYKDTHLNDEYRLVRALEILDQGDHLQDSSNPETLGLAGAIHKRLWQVRNDKRELETSLRYYRRGHEADRANEFEKQGYPGINAAFILDSLASLESETDGSAEATQKLIDARHDEATEIREQIVDGLLPMLDGNKESPEKDDYWAIATLAEAYYGLYKLEEARTWLEVARKIKEIPSWEFETTARQLTDLARLLVFEGTKTADDFAESEAGRVLLVFLGDSVAGLRSAYVGKVGLALSGGGFRASLFHIGVLARLAELDQLRYIEVISCVSGGSIIGAYYYLELRKLLMDKLDADITRQDYIDLVKRVQKGFLKGVQTNIRMRIAAEWTTNLKMIFSKGYSRTQRLGELYEEKLFSEIDDGCGDKPRYMSDLLVIPKDNKDKGEKSFNPRQQNWSRANKVPILILNATALNTGHNWQFTASWMGEPPTTVNPEIDTNYRLRRLYYDDAPAGYREVRLGTAVGASSCVPGLFEPVVLEDLYEHPREHDENEKITVRLVDGGVHDNQGVVGLIEQDCVVMLVSDASGQMGAVDNPSNGLLAVPLRTNSILMSRVRNAEYDDLMSRIRSRELREKMFIHLKMDLRSDPVDWVGSSEPAQSADVAAGKSQQDQETNYRINRRVQRFLAGNRTDLDAWNDAEAYALMLSAYRMTQHELDPLETTLPMPKPIEPVDDPKWDFMEADDLQKAANEDSMFMRILKVGSKTPLKVWYLYKPLQVLGLIIAVIAIGALCYFAWKYWDSALVTVGGIGGIVLTIVVAAVFGKLVMKIVWFRQTLMKILFGIGMSLFGFLVARLHLHVFNPIYLRLGSMSCIHEMKRTAVNGS
jgi:predicted acylesterase/phospholipase RssA